MSNVVACACRIVRARTGHAHMHACQMSTMLHLIRLMTVHSDGKLSKLFSLFAFTSVLFVGFLCFSVFISIVIFWFFFYSDFLSVALH